MESLFFVSRETKEKFYLYFDLLLRWNATINLIGNNEDVWHRHFEDCAQLYSLIPNPTQITGADLGSGAGLPGIILAILGVGQMHLVESDQRKAAFLQEVIRLTDSQNIILHPMRIENISLPRCNFLTARALAPLTKLLRLVSPFLEENTFCLFPKGKNWAMEENAAREIWDFHCIAYSSKTDPQAAILRIDQVKTRHVPLP